METLRRHWYGLINRPDGTISRTNLTTTIAWIVATMWISYEVYHSMTINWETLCVYLAFATGNSSWNKYLAVRATTEPETK